MKANVVRVVSVLFLLSTMAACGLETTGDSGAALIGRNPIEVPDFPPVLVDATAQIPIDSGSGLPVQDSGSIVPIADGGTIVDGAIADAAPTCDSGLDCGPVDSDFPLCDGDAGVSSDAMLSDEFGAADYGVACRAKKCPDDLDASEKHLYEFCIAAVPISAIKKGCDGLVQPWKYICKKIVGGGVAKACCNAVVDTVVPPGHLCAEIHKDSNPACVQCCGEMFKANGPNETWRILCTQRCAAL